MNPNTTMTKIGSSANAPSVSAMQDTLRCRLEVAAGIFSY